jgi:DNA end-binding protein Ku
MAAIAKKVLTFSLVSIPVSIHPATSQHRVPLKMVHAQDGGRIRQKRVCEADGQEVAEWDIARGYELPGGETLVLSREDLADLPMPDTREIRVLGFLPAGRVDPIYYDKPYYLTANGTAAARPYALLREALQQSGQIGIARTALRTRDSLVALAVRGDAILMTTLLWPDEVRSVEGIAPARLELRPEEVRLATQLMDAVSEGFELEAERDEYTRALEQVVDAKLAGLPAPHAPEARVLPPAGRVSDLIAVLEAAVAKAQEDRPKANGKRLAKKTTDRKSAGRHPG